MSKRIKKKKHPGEVIDMIPRHNGLMFCMKTGMRRSLIKDSITLCCLVVMLRHLFLAKGFYLLMIMSTRKLTGLQKGPQRWIQMAPLEPKEIELILGFNKKRSRGAFS